MLITYKESKERLKCHIHDAIFKYWCVVVQCHISNVLENIHAFEVRQKEAFYQFNMYT